MAGVFTEALQPERSARRAQRRARREQRKTLVLALVQRLLQLDAAEQGEKAAQQAELGSLAAAVAEQATAVRLQQTLLEAASKARQDSTQPLPASFFSAVATGPEKPSGGSAHPDTPPAAGAVGMAPPDAPQPKVVCPVVQPPSHAHTAAGRSGGAQRPAAALAAPPVGGPRAASAAPSVGEQAASHRSGTAQRPAAPLAAQSVEGQNSAPAAPSVGMRQGRSHRSGTAQRPAAPLAAQRGERPVPAPAAARARCPGAPASPQLRAGHVAAAASTRNTSPQGARRAVPSRRAAAEPTQVSLEDLQVIGVGYVSSGSAARVERDLRPDWDDTMAKPAAGRRSNPSPDLAPDQARGPQAIFAEAQRAREALKRRMLAGAPASPHADHNTRKHGCSTRRHEVWPTARRGNYTGVSSDPNTGWPVGGASFPGASSDEGVPSCQHITLSRRASARGCAPRRAALQQLDALEARMVCLVGRVGRQLQDLDPEQGLPGPASPPSPAAQAGRERSRLRTLAPPPAAVDHAPPTDRQAAQVQAPQPQEDLILDGVAASSSGAARACNEAVGTTARACAAGKRPGADPGAQATASTDYAGWEQGAGQAGTVAQAVRSHRAGTRMAAAGSGGGAAGQEPGESGPGHEAAPFARGDRAGALGHASCGACASAQAVVSGGAGLLEEVWGVAAQELLEAGEQLCEELFVQEFL